MVSLASMVMRHYCKTVFLYFFLLFSFNFSFLNSSNFFITSNEDFCGKSEKKTKTSGCLSICCHLDEKSLPDINKKLIYNDENFKWKFQTAYSTPFINFLVHNNSPPLS